MKPVREQLSENEMRAAWRRRDPSYDGVFFFGVTTTGIFCRPSCPSRPKVEHLKFFQGADDAVQAGFRPCRRCSPQRSDGRPPDWIAKLQDQVSASPERRHTARDLREMGLAPERVRRWFQKHRGMTFTAWCRNFRMSRASRLIQSGQSPDEVGLDHGFESSSGFRSAFTRLFGQSPGIPWNGDHLQAILLETPLGPMLAAASATSLCQLEFAEQPGLEQSHERLRRRFRLPVLPGENSILRQLRQELAEYFGGRRREFSIPVQLKGTPFQQRVWEELCRIPFGQTTSYEAIATRVGSPRSVRAVARANATNPLYLVVPCHRVIAKNGGLSGYGAGVWRKRRLLELEQTQ